MTNRDWRTLRTVSMHSTLVCALHEQTRGGHNPEVAQVIGNMAEWHAH